MNPADFDRLAARARDPQLIPGIYDYCDRRCPRCPFNERCLTFLDMRELDTEQAASSLAGGIGASFRRARDLILEVARREGIGRPVVETNDEEDADSERHDRDPLVVSAREYGHLAWRVTKALQPLIVLRGDAALIDAVDTIEWFSTMISSKTYRAVAGYEDGWEDHQGVQTDFNGSAKVALIGIAESREAWAVLMEAGKAAADGVPAQAVRMLDDLHRALRVRFPTAMAFVRPGFDEPLIAADAQSLGS